MKELIEQMYKDAEEMGDMHNEGCPCNMEDPDTCDCDNMKAIKYLAEKWMVKVNDYWIDMAKAHRPHCSPAGNKMLTAMMGKVNRKPKFK